MANGFFPLVAPNAGGGLNFEPVYNALSDLQTNRYRQQQMDMQQQNALMDQRRWQAQDARAQQELGFRREEIDMKRADAPLDRSYRQAQIDLASAQAKAAGQKNALEEAIAGMLNGQNGPQGSPAAPSSGGNSLFQPQSFQGAPPPQAGFQQVSNALAPSQPIPQQPGMQLAADDGLAQEDQPSAPGGGVPSPGAVYNLPGEGLVNTPLGPMPRDKARRLGLGLALGGKGDAGKMMIDAASAGSGMSKTAAAENDKTELGASNQIARLEQITKTFNPDYLNVPNRVKYWGNDLVSKFTSLPPKDQKDLEGYSGFRRDTFANLNKVLKEISGTAVTENEMQRMLKELPNPGTGVFDGDSPPAFSAKLKGSIEAAKLAVARARYLRSNGFRGKPWEAGVEIDSMRDIINQRGAQIEQQLKQQNPQIDRQRLDMTVQQNLKQEFGI